MDDLRRRFAGLDQLRAPELWDEIELRATAIGSTTAVTAVRAPRPAAWPTRRSRPLLRLLTTTIVLVALLAGALAVGSGMVKLPAIMLPAPSDVALRLIPCAEAQQSARKAARGWTAGPAAGPSSGVRSGWIAAWGTEAVPEVILVHPVTGEVCPLVRLEQYEDRSPENLIDPNRIPTRGKLAWSPDGTALAFTIAAEHPVDGLRQALFVWSSDGLFGPMLEGSGAIHLELPRWSPDGSLLAVTESWQGWEPPADYGTNSVWLVAADGSAPRELAVDCEHCYAGPAFWSPDGERLAVYGHAGISVGSVSDATLAPLPGTARWWGGNHSPGWGSDITQLIAWADDSSLLLTHPAGGDFASVPSASGRFVTVPVDRPNDWRVRGPTRITAALSILSPDGTMWASVTGSSDADANLVVTELGSRARRTVASGPLMWVPMTWSPDSRHLVFVHDPTYTADHGLWIANADGTGLRELTTHDFALELWGEPTASIAWQPIWPRKTR